MNHLRNEEIPVAFLHSLGADAGSWARVVDLLPADMLAITPETPAHGEQPRPGEHSLLDWVASLRRQIRAEHQGPVHLVGVSMGGFQAVAYAALHPEEVRSLVVSDSFIYLPEQTVEARLNSIDASVVEAGMRGYAERYVETTLTRDVPEPHPGRLVDAIAGIPADDYAAVAAVCFGVDARKLAARVVCPSLVLIGDRDEKTPRVLSEEVATALGESLIVEIPGSGHLPNLDAPEEFVRVIVDFIRNPSTRKENPHRS
ncbi:hypothetical protein H490_0105630 [Leucobacter sp. UCD-THU]|uniref:Alpha/beta hydrolase n=1 Tax=Leucobacter muris TaxID=1935379 RepID=A0ABX5QHX5_9MICO|nr:MULTISPECIES: alpha/beta fold hydrolase [Leucobacter]EYT55287.1 hypothetical protein H490_0105630 [Leucobacter sp. UCD-THU]QAB18687.1 alpha/beta hydrolase [Leucobacter muris]